MIREKCDYEANLSQLWNLSEQLGYTEILTDSACGPEDRGFGSHLPPLKNRHFLDWGSAFFVSLLMFFLLLPQLNFAKKAKSEREFIKEGKRRNANAFQVFLTQRNFLYGEHLTARFSWGSNNKGGTTPCRIKTAIHCTSLTATKRK